MKHGLLSLALAASLVMTGTAEAGKKKSKKVKEAPIEAVETTRIELLGRWEAQYSEEQQRMLDMTIRVLEGPDFTEEELEELELSDDDKLYIAMVQMVRNLDSESAEKQNFQAQIEAMKQTPVVQFFEDRMEVSLGSEVRVLSYTLTTAADGQFELLTTLEGTEEAEKSLVEAVDADTIVMKGPNGQAMTLIRKPLASTQAESTETVEQTPRRDEDCADGESQLGEGACMDDK